MVDYIAKIKPINADKIETQAHGIATFSENGNSLHIHVEMFDTPANIEHWEHISRWETSSCSDANAGRES